jgi:hypothetical protein
MRPNWLRRANLRRRRRLQLAGPQNMQPPHLRPRRRGIQTNRDGDKQNQPHHKHRPLHVMAGLDPAIHAFCSTSLGMQ